MSEDSKHNIEEMLSDYIDGELSDRKKTELKRLMEHDESLKQRLDELKKQKQLLNSLPSESAPKGLLDDVMNSLERKFILNEYTAASAESEGHKHLFFRRLLTAAIIMVLFGGLVGIVINIIMPAAKPESNYVAENPQQNYHVFEPVAAIDIPDPDKGKTPVFSASLNLETHHTIAMNTFIKKALFNNNLNDYVAPPRSDGSETTIKITCPINKLVAFLGDLKAEWGRCTGTTLAVYDHAIKDDIIIEGISGDDMLQIFGEGKFYARMQKVNDIADFKDAGIENSRLATVVTEGPIEIRPELTTGERNSNLDSDDEDTEKVSLVIRVIGL